MGKFNRKAVNASQRKIKHWEKLIESNRNLINALTKPKEVLPGSSGGRKFTVEKAIKTIKKKKLLKVRGNMILWLDKSYQGKDGVGNGTFGVFDFLLKNDFRIIKIKDDKKGREFFYNNSNAVIPYNIIKQVLV